MSAVAETSLCDLVARLEADNKALRAGASANWQLQARVQDLEHQNKELARKLAVSESISEKRRLDVLFWKKAVRYEQAIKKPRKIVRHLPLFNEVRRAKRRDEQDHYGYRTNPESFFLREWRKINKRVSGLNHGRGTLEILMSEDNDACADLAQRDCTVAATVIQWLGTNCGKAFIWEVERKIKESIDRERAARKP